MIIIGNGLLQGVLNVYTFMIASILINIVVGFNFRKQLLSGCHCSYSKSIKDQLTTGVLLFFLSIGVVILTADISFSIASILFYDTQPQDLKTHYINLTVTLSVAFSNMLFKTIISFINKNGMKIAERFMKINVNKETEK